MSALICEASADELYTPPVCVANSRHGYTGDVIGGICPVKSTPGPQTLYLIPLSFAKAIID